MAKKGKQKQRDREKRRQATAAKRAKKREGRPASRPPAVDAHHHRRLSIDAPHERTLAPVHLDATGAVVPDPRALLGLGAGPLDEEQVRRAFRAALEAHPPEAEPELARQIREARDRLLDPEQVFLRELGVVRIPDADARGLPTDPPGGDPDLLDAEARLAAQAVLYALVEDALR